MISVVIPVYNGEEYVVQAVESVLNQSLKVDEIVVVDDCSEDRTPELLKEHFGSLIKYHRNHKNMERCYSRNRGFELSRGDYVFFLDHDDLWAREHVERTMENWGDSYMVYTFPRTTIDSKGRIKRVSKKSIPKNPFLIAFSGLLGYPSATAFKRDYFLPYKDEYMLREDWEVFLRAILMGYKIKVLDHNTVYIREHVSRTSKSSRLYQGTIKVYQDYRDRIEKKYLPYFLFHVGDVCLRFGDLGKGWGLVAEALKREPRLLLSFRNLLTILKRGFRFWRVYD